MVGVTPTIRIKEMPFDYAQGDNVFFDFHLNVIALGEIPTID
jgi:hypothetical protein